MNDLEAAHVLELDADTAFALGTDANEVTHDLEVFEFGGDVSGEHGVASFVNLRTVSTPRYGGKDGSLRTRTLTERLS
jgi:hypothetical protein